MPPQTRDEKEALLDTNLDVAEARRHEPKAGADLGERPTQAVRSRTAGEQSQRLEAGALKRPPIAQAQELAQRRNTTPAQAGSERNEKHQTANHEGSTTTDHAKHSFENLAGPQAASGRTARLSNGEGHEPLWLAYADVRAA